MKFKGAWQAHFLSHALHILKIIITFEDVLLLILVFFDISHGLEDRKIGTHCPLHLTLPILKILRGQKVGEKQPMVPSSPQRARLNGGIHLKILGAVFE